jgi:hypothetical protein
MYENSEETLHIAWRFGYPAKITGIVQNAYFHNVILVHPKPKKGLTFTLTTHINLFSGKKFAEFIPPSTAGSCRDNQPQVQHNCDPVHNLSLTF